MKSANMYSECNSDRTISACKHITTACQIVQQTPHFIIMCLSPVASSIILLFFKWVHCLYNPRGFPGKSTFDPTAERNIWDTYTPRHANVCPIGRMRVTDRKQRPTTLIAWISNHIPSMLGEITYSFPNYNNRYVEVWGGNWSLGK